MSMFNKFKIFMSLFVTGLALSSCNNINKLAVYSPSQDTSDDIFDFYSNSILPEVTLDGKLDDARWSASDVITLGSFDNSDIESGEYGAIVGDILSYAETKRGVIKMFRGEVGFHFGIEIRDNDICYKALNDDDDAIYTDNVLINLCTQLDGATIPMADDYYLLVTAFNNQCFRRGANAPGLWGAFTGIIDYQAEIFKDDFGKDAGFIVEMLVPYSEIGISKDSPVGITFRSCNRYSESKTVIEFPWFYKGGIHPFNTPNEYIVWGEDNHLYEYYECRRPNVTVNGVLWDYVINQPIPNVVVNDLVTTDSRGKFTLEDVNSNLDLELRFTSPAILENQKYIVSRNIMRVANGMPVDVNIKLFTKDNLITKLVKGSIETEYDYRDIEVVIGENTVNVDADGGYEISCTFLAEYETITVKRKDKPFGYDDQICINDGGSAQITKNLTLPLIDKYPDKFGKYGDIETFIGWKSDSLLARFIVPSRTNGVALAISSDDMGGKIVLYHQIGTMCVTDFINYAWNYAPPASFGSEASIHVNPQGQTVYTFTVPFELIGIENKAEIKVAPFEYSYSGEFHYYKLDNGTQLTFGNTNILNYYPLFSSSGILIIGPTETVTSSMTLEPFGKGNAVAKFEYIDANGNKSLRITIEYTANAKIWGYGIMLGDLVNNRGTTDLFALGYETFDHKEYGDWNWRGEYIYASSLGVVYSQFVVEDKSYMVADYPLAVLNGSNYDLKISNSTQEIGVQLFEYVTDASGNLYSVYNCINVDGVPKAFDQGVSEFVRFSLV